MPTPLPTAYDCRFGYLNLTCGERLLLPLYLDLASPEHAAVAGPNFALSGRTRHVAVFRFALPAVSGWTSTVTLDTCDPRTTFGTRLSVYASCPDPWAAAADADAAGMFVGAGLSGGGGGGGNSSSGYASRALGFNDDDPTCTTGALTAAGASRASLLTLTFPAGADEAPPQDLFLLVERDGSTDVVTDDADPVFYLSLSCHVDTPPPSPAPTAHPTALPTEAFVTRLALTARLRLELVDAAAFDAPAAREAFAEAMADVRAHSPRTLSSFFCSHSSERP
jgi:hypothetical protein